MEALGQLQAGLRRPRGASPCLPTSRAPAPPAPLPAAGLYSKTNPQYAPLGLEPLVLYPSYDDKNSGGRSRSQGAASNEQRDLLAASLRPSWLPCLPCPPRLSCFWSLAPSLG